MSSAPTLSAWSAPGIGSAVGLIGLYLALQVGVGMLGVALLHRMQEAATGALQPAQTAILAFAAVGTAAFAVVLLARWRWPRLWPGRTPPGFGVCAVPQWRWLLIAVLVGLLAPWLGGVITHVLARGHEVGQNVEQIVRNAPLGGRIALAVLAISIAPVAEELLFRGVLLSALIPRCGLPVGALLSAAAFAAIHLPGLGWHWYALPQLLLLGVALAWLRVHGHSLWPAVLAHGVHNALALGVLFSALGAGV
ncbi:MAG: type II CAAX endopeptidase family protein [Rhodanobacter sp.]